MATAIKNFPEEEYLMKGNAACAGCASNIAFRIVSKALGPNAIMVMTPSCAVASTGLLPKSAYRYPILNVCFAAGAVSASGIEYALEALQKKGKHPGELPTVFTWIGDGGTYDIGLQSLSAAAERNDNIIHFCYNNEAYSNTGVQRSGATPQYAMTTTSPSGKKESKKSVPLMMLEHKIPYMATASISHPADLYDKVMKAKSIKGFKYIEIFAPCHPGWHFPSEQTVEIAKMAVNSGAWLLWEAEAAKLSFSAPTKRLLDGKTPKLPLEDYLRAQGRFKPLFRAEDSAEKLAALQA